MKTRILWVSFWAAFIMSGLALGGEPQAPYEFTSFNITIPAHSDAVVWLKDVNTGRWILASTFWTDAQGQPKWGSLKAKLNGRMNKLTQVEIFFDCTGESINDAGQVAGHSVAGPCVRQPDGRVVIFAGVSQASGFGSA